MKYWHLRLVLLHSTGNKTSTAALRLRASSRISAHHHHHRTHARTHAHTHTHTHTHTGSIGIALFQWLMGDWNFRTVFWVTTLIGIVAASFDMVTVKPKRSTLNPHRYRCGVTNSNSNSNSMWHPSTLFFNPKPSTLNAHPKSHIPKPLIPEPYNLTPNP